MIDKVFYYRLQLIAEVFIIQLIGNQSNGLNREGRITLSSWFKHTKKKYGEGRRVFLMAPLHHHYQKKGIPEPRIVTRFWIIGIILAVSTLALLKVR